MENWSRDGGRVKCRGLGKASQRECYLRPDIGEVQGDEGGRASGTGNKEPAARHR